MRAAATASRLRVPAARYGGPRGPRPEGEQAGTEPAARRRPGLQDGRESPGAPGVASLAAGGGGGVCPPSPAPEPPVTVGGPSRSPGPRAAPTWAGSGARRRRAKGREAQGGAGAVFSFPGFWRLCMAQGGFAGMGLITKIRRRTSSSLPVLCRCDRFLMRNDSSRHA